MEPKGAQFARNEFEDDLWRKGTRDERLVRPHELAFTVLFGTREDAECFADRLARDGHRATAAEYAGDEQMPWRIDVRTQLQPVAEEIARLHYWLMDLAGLLHGRVLIEPSAERQPLTPI